MATLGAKYPTLVDVAKSVNPNGTPATVAELLSQTNEMLADMPWYEANDMTGHTMTVRTGLPTPAWRAFNEGVQPTKSSKAQIKVGLGMLEDWSEVDCDLASLSGNLGAFRLSEAKAHLEGMNQEMQSTVFYGNTLVSPKEIHGLSVLYSDVTANNGQNIIDAGGAGNDNASIWLVCWSEETVFGLYPKGSVAGLYHEDLGKQVANNAGGTTGALMMVYRDRWQWKAGLGLKDWRYACRIGSIDISQLVDDSSAPDLTKLMTKATHRIPNLKMGRCAFYMNRSLIQYLDIQRQDRVTNGGGITYENVDGKIVPHFRGIPIRLVDALTESEALV